MEDYTEQSLIITDQGVVTGLEQIKGFIAQAMEMMAAEPTTDMKMLTKEIQGDVAFHTWTGGPKYPYGAESYVIRDGKISTHTMGMYVPQ